MKNFKTAILVFMLSATVIVFQSGYAAPPANCRATDSTASAPLQTVTLPPTDACTPRESNGFPLPDPACTPGAINPTVTLDVLQDKTFKTGCVRDGASTAKQKNATYGWYHIKHPANNTGATQTCELDHLISLELGGADTLDNLWPQCGPNRVALVKRYFKQKDMVENYLAAQVKSGAIPLDEAQKGIASDWTQYLDDAKKACKGKKC
jgi:hypothetical protein